jgi:hypothetical protein
MGEFKKGMSEGELLTALLEGLTPEQAFMVGQVMGIMGKGDKMHITRLEQEIVDLKRQLVFGVHNDAVFGEPMGGKGDT